MLLGLLGLVAAALAAEQWECAMVPMHGSTLRAIPQKDASDMHLTPYLLPEGWTPIGAVTAYSLLPSAIGADSKPMPHLVICRRLDAAGAAAVKLEDAGGSDFRSCEEYATERQKWIDKGFPAEEFADPPDGCR